MIFRAFWPDRISWIVGLGTTLALSSQSIPFWIVGALKTIGYDDQQASLMVTAELFAMGLTMFLISPLIYRLPFKTTISGAVVAALAAQIVAVLSHDVFVMTATRICSGVAFGVIFSVATAAGSNSKYPEKTYAAAGCILLVIGTTLNPLLGYCFSNYGRPGVFVGLCLYCLLNTVPLLLIPTREVLDRPVRDSQREDPTAVPFWGALAVFGLMFLMAISMNGVFTFLGQISEHVGLDGAALGAGLALVSLLSALGGLFANWLGIRGGHTAPLMLGFLVLGLGLYTLTINSSVAIFWIVATIVVGCYWFIWPYIFGLAVIVDSKGRVASATGSAKIVAGGFGSAIAGYVVLHHGLAAFGKTALAICVFASLMVPIIVRAAKRASA